MALTRSQTLTFFSLHPAIFFVPKLFVGLALGYLLSNLRGRVAALLWAVFSLCLLGGDYSFGAGALQRWGDGLLLGVAAAVGVWRARRTLRGGQENPFCTNADPRSPDFVAPPAFPDHLGAVSLHRQGTETQCLDPAIEKDGFPRSFAWSVDPPRGFSPFLRLFYMLFDPIRFSLNVGRWARSSGSRRVVPFFAKRNGIDLTQFVSSEGKGEFKSFDQFFTRRFKEMPTFFVGAAPCEGKVIYMGRGGHDRVLLIKGETISLSELLGEEWIALLPERLGVIVTYLSPRDYHLGHSPVEGKVIGKRRIPGFAWTVQPSIWKEPKVEGRPGPHYLAFNARDVLVKETAQGLLATVYVAATNVYSTEIHPEVGEVVGAGRHEQSYHFGSTNVYVFDADRYDFPRGMHPGQQLQFGRTPFMIPAGLNPSTPSETKTS